MNDQHQPEEESQDPAGLPSAGATSDDQTQQNTGEAETAAEAEELKQSFRDTLRKMWRFVRITMNIVEGTDKSGTVERIKNDIDFRGTNVWVLMCAIFICSIGLNTSSTAVVIGAMLISPLMGPILGIGVAVGTNDWQTLLRSIKSLGVAVFISLTVSALYFLLTPLSESTSELLGRTRPTSLDVFVAIFGGLAGIIAGSRKAFSNVIPGVAIATALMPPLCTAGYGLATGQASFFFGAFYLFLLNTVFISLSTLVVVRYLRFPLVHFVDPIHERKYKRYILIFVLLVVLPSGWVFWGVIRETVFERNARMFLSEVVYPEHKSSIDPELNYDPDSPSIELTYIGQRIPQALENQWKSQLQNYGLATCMLKVNQAEDASELMEEKIGKMRDELQANLMQDILYDTQEKLAENERLLRNLKRKIERYRRDSIPYDQIRKELAINYPDMRRFAYGVDLEADSAGQLDTLPTVSILWPATMPEEDQLANEQKICALLKLRWNLDTVRVLRY